MNTFSYVSAYNGSYSYTQFYWNPSIMFPRSLFLHFPNNKVFHIKILYYLNGFHLSVVQQLGNNKSQANKNSNKARVN